MYSIEIFERIIKSNLTDEEVYDRINILAPIKTLNRYVDLNDSECGIYEGGIGSNDLFTVMQGIYPIKMKYDDSRVYVAFIHELRKNLIDYPDIEFYLTLLNTIYDFSKEFFFLKDNPEAKENSKLFNELYKKFDNDLVQARSSYVVNLNVAEFDEKNRAVIYPISKMQGVGEGISSAEINSTACNLLEFSGIHAYLVIGTLDNDYSKVHPFVVYRSRNGNYNLMDSALQISVQNMFPSGFHLEEGFRFKAVVKSKDSNGDKRRRVTRYFSYPCELLDVSFKR